MSFILATLIVAQQPLPFIDRTALRKLALREQGASADMAAKACSKRSEFARSFSMIGSKISFPETACVQRRVTSVGSASVRLAAK